MNSPARVIGFVNAAHFIDHYSMLIFAAAVIVMGPALGMAYSELLPYATPGFVAFGAGSLLTGWLGDRWSRRHMMVIFFVGIGASMIAVGLVQTKLELGAAQRQFLAGLPLTVTDGDRLYVHADASDPADWIYVASTSEAARSLTVTPAQLTLCGHIHQPAVYSMSATAKMTAFTPTTGSAVPLLQGRRWLVVLGSVGQPRDGNPAASYAMLDTDKRELTYCRAAYDIEQAAAAIRNKGLPVWLANRLFQGR